jgi:hypothetical protein
MNTPKLDAVVKCAPKSIIVKGIEQLRKKDSIELNEFPEEPFVKIFGTHFRKLVAKDLLPAPSTRRLIDYTDEYLVNGFILYKVLDKHFNINDKIQKNTNVNVDERMLKAQIKNESINVQDRNGALLRYYTVFGNNTQEFCRDLRKAIIKIGVHTHIDTHSKMSIPTRRYCESNGISTRRVKMTIMNDNNYVCTRSLVSNLNTVWTTHGFYLITRKQLKRLLGNVTTKSVTLDNVNNVNYYPQPRVSFDPRVTTAILNTKMKSVKNLKQLKEEIEEASNQKFNSVQNAVRYYIAHRSFSPNMNKGKNVVKKTAKSWGKTKSKPRKKKTVDDKKPNNNNKPNASLPKRDMRKTWKNAKNKIVKDIEKKRMRNPGAKRKIKKTSEIGRGYKPFENAQNTGYRN